MLKRESLNVPVISVAKAGWNLGSVELLVLLENFTGWERWKEIRVDRLFAAKIVTSGESPGRPAHYYIRESDSSPSHFQVALCGALPLGRSGAGRRR